MEAEGLDGPATCVGVDTAPDPPRLPRGHAPWLRAAHVVRALALVTERLHALLCAVSLSDLSVAVVLGSSLLFPQWTAMVRLEGGWDACANGIDDTDECRARRRKAAALLERKVTRGLMEALPMSTLSAPTRWCGHLCTFAWLDGTRGRTGRRLSLRRRRTCARRRRTVPRPCVPRAPRAWARRCRAYCISAVPRALPLPRTHAAVRARRFLASRCVAPPRRPPRGGGGPHVTCGSSATRTSLAWGVTFFSDWLPCVYACAQGQRSLQTRCIVRDRLARS